MHAAPELSARERDIRQHKRAAILYGNALFTFDAGTYVFTASILLMVWTQWIALWSDSPTEPDATAALCVLITVPLRAVAHRINKRWTSMVRAIVAAIVMALGFGDVLAVIRCIAACLGHCATRALQSQECDVCGRMGPCLIHLIFTVALLCTSTGGAVCLIRLRRCASDAIAIAQADASIQQNDAQ